MPEKRLLVVDDEADFLHLLETALTDRGYRVLTATDIETAQAIFQESYPHLVLTDIRMSGGSGDELLAAIRQSHQTPVVLMTGYSDLTVEEAFSQGAEALLTKPFSLQELFDLVERLTDPSEGEPESYTSTPLSLKLSVRINNKEASCERFNVARGGMFIAIEDDLPRILDRVHFQFDFQEDGIPPLEGMGLVRWVRPKSQPGLPKGVGIEFLNLPPGPRSRLLHLVDIDEVKAFIPANLASVKKAG